MTLEEFRETLSRGEKILFDSMNKLKVILQESLAAKAVSLRKETFIHLTCNSENFMYLCRQLPITCHYQKFVIRNS